jgi:hypothetical protein
MDRRKTSRVDLRLTCRIVNQGLVSENSGGTTENISRNGLLLRWTRPVPVPQTGAALRVELELPSEGMFAPRVIRCDSTVVRVIAGENGQSYIALKVNTMRFVDDTARIWAGSGRFSTPLSEFVN